MKKLTLEEVAFSMKAEAAKVPGDTLHVSKELWLEIARRIAENGNEGEEEKRKETTRIITAKITFIDKSGEICSKADEAEIAKNIIKDMLNADDVAIVSVQDFESGE